MKLNLWCFVSGLKFLLKDSNFRQSSRLWPRNILTSTNSPYLLHLVIWSRPIMRKERLSVWLGGGSRGEKTPHVTCVHVFTWPKIRAPEDPRTSASKLNFALGVGTQCVVCLFWAVFPHFPTLPRHGMVWNEWQMQGWGACFSCPADSILPSNYWCHNRTIPSGSSLAKIGTSTSHRRKSTSQKNCTSSKFSTPKGYSIPRGSWSSGTHRIPREDSASTICSALRGTCSSRRHSSPQITFSPQTNFRFKTRCAKVHGAAK